MADLLLSHMLQCEIEQSIITSAIKDGSPIKFKDVTVPLSEFIPHFLAYLREKLSISTHTTSAYFSPRQLEKRKKEKAELKKDEVDTKKTVPKKTARLSLQYASSSPMKTIPENKHPVNIVGISPIKNTPKAPSQTNRKNYGATSPLQGRKFTSPSQTNKKNHVTRSPVPGTKTTSPVPTNKKTYVMTSPVLQDNKVTLQSEANKKNYAVTSPVQDCNALNGSRNNFELNSLDDFPSISFTSPAKNPRRIRATKVTTSKSSFTSSKTDTSKTNSFLEESSFEMQHCDPSLDKIFLDDKLFLDDKRFAKSSMDSSTMSVDGNLTHSVGSHTCDELDFSAMSCSSMKKITTKSLTENINIENIKDKDVIDLMVDTYICIWLTNLIPNFTLELYFLFITLTIPLNVNNNVNLTHPFNNVESCVYFAAKSLQQLVGFIALLDEKVLNLILSNSRLKKVASVDFVSSIQDAINKDVASSIKRKPDIIKSPMTGIPFQVESDNRKSFVCDKHFYSFSKKRDAFYTLVREWQDNYLDPDWNMKQFMTRKVPDIMKMNTEVSTHYQFAKLFVAQLLETCRNYVGNQTNNEPEESSLLIDLKKRNPSKYQSLQDRLTRPSFSNDPCPKPSFSIVEQFFKEFIDIADGYCFSKILKHVLITYILEINSNSFGLDVQLTKSFNKSDFAESLWAEIKVAVSELRLLAKFLGYVVFLPYNYSSDYIDSKISKSRPLLAEPLDFSDYLYNSYKSHKLLITVPWIVDFFSMADKRALDHVVYSKSIKYLVSLYQCTYMRMQNNTLLLLSLMLHIGWLFELPHIESVNFYDADLITKNVFQYGGDAVVGIDDLVCIDKEFLYSLCPYLNDIKKPLVDFAQGANISMSGSFRKITPVRTSDVFSIDMKSNLKIQLIDSLMRYVSNQVKDVMKFVTEKHFMNVKHHISEVIIPACCGKVLENIKEKFRIDENIGDVTPEELKLNNNDVYEVHVECGKEEISSASHNYLQTYLKEKVFVSMEALLPESTHKKVLEVSSKVVKHNVRLKVQEWMTANRDLYLNEANHLYGRYIMSIIKAAKDTTTENY